MSTEATGNLHGEPYRSVGQQTPVQFLISPKVDGMTREEAHSRCPDDSYVEYYGNQWLIVPFAPVEQPRFFVCRPGGHALVA